MWVELAKKIQHLNYVVQRNWQNLPASCVVGDHDDLDLFVSDEDRAELEEIIKDYPLVDCRSKSDGYYPPVISDFILRRKLRHCGFYIPNGTAHFLSLYYHNLVHKEGDPYKEELEKIFLEIELPTKCTDSGVGFYV